MNIRKLPIGIQSFESLRKENYLYVDKTEFIWNLVNLGKTYFLSRPRRFGKSLLISTFKAYFEGKKELFEGLKISELETEWKKYPVFHFDFNGKDYSGSSSLAAVINSHLESWEKLYGDEKKERSLEERFAYLLENAYEKTGLGCVVLVDEYDKSLLESESEILESNRRLFKGFFGNLKKCDEFLKFTFITGVTKFSKVSIFSDLNQLQDISLYDQYSSICGITQEEMEKTFVLEIQLMAQKNDLTFEGCLEKLKEMYDGYHFSRISEGMYNPFSLIHAFASCEFECYWFSTGTPTFLVEKIKSVNFEPKLLTSDELAIDTNSISDYRSDNLDPLPLLYQTGYLTIKKYDKEYQQYYLGYPNKEVKYAFLKSLVPIFYSPADTCDALFIVNFVKDLRLAKIDEVLNRLKSLFARLPYSTKNDDSVIEQNFQNVIYIVFMLMGQFVNVEEHYSFGRADCVVQTKDYIFIFEFKRDKSAQEALNQINEKKYAESFNCDKRKLFKIGVNFSSVEKNICEWIVE